MNTNESWTARQNESDDARREYERERLAIWALDEISEAMEKANLSKADIARVLGTSRSHITQVFSGSRNVTLGTLSDLAWACGFRAAVKLEPLRIGAFTSSPVIEISNVRPLVVETRTQSSAFPIEVSQELMLGCGG